jgi:hypothetical protein
MSNMCTKKRLNIKPSFRVEVGDLRGDLTLKAGTYYGTNALFLVDIYFGTHFWLVQSVPLYSVGQKKRDVVFRSLGNEPDGHSGPTAVPRPLNFPE